MKGNKRIGSYTLKQEIGKGNFAIAYMATKSDEPQGENNQYAVKCITKQVS